MVVPEVARTRGGGRWAGRHRLGGRSRIGGGGREPGGGRVGKAGAGSGNDAGQDHRAQPAHPGRPGNSGERHARAGPCRVTVYVTRHVRQGQGRGTGPRVVRRQGQGRGTGPSVVRRQGQGQGRGAGSRRTRRQRERGRATARSRPVGAKGSLPGNARCARMVLHFATPVRETYRRGVGHDNGLGDEFPGAWKTALVRLTGAGILQGWTGWGDAGGRPHPPAPS